MPRYRYNGRIRYVCSDYDIRVDPGEEFVTPYVLPREWVDFELLDYDEGTRQGEFTQTLEINSVHEIDISYYNKLQAILLNPQDDNSVKLNIHIDYPDAPPIVLDTHTPVWRCEINIATHISKLYLSPRAGVPIVKLLCSSMPGMDLSRMIGVSSGAGVVVPPTVNSVIIGDYPGTQTAAKAGDVIQVTGTTSNNATQVKLLDYEAFNESGWVNVNSDGSFTINGIVSNRTGNNMHAKVVARNSEGTESEEVISSNAIKLDQVIPSFNFLGISYPSGQNALKGNEQATVHLTVSNFDTIEYVDPTGQLTIDNPNSYEEYKTVTLNNPQVYNYTNPNFVVTAYRQANGASATFSHNIHVADKAPVLTVEQPQARLQTAPSPGAVYTITVRSDQVLTSAPDLNIPVSGTWEGSGFTGSGTIFTRNIRIQDGDATGSGAWVLLNSPTNEAGIEVSTVVGEEVVGGFVERELTIDAWPNRQADIGTHVTDTSKLWCENLSKGGDGPHGGTIFTYSPTINNEVNKFTIIDDSGNPDPHGHIWYNKDLNNAVSNTSGTAKVLIREDP